MIEGTIVYKKQSVEWVNDPVNGVTFVNEIVSSNCVESYFKNIERIMLLDMVVLELNKWSEIDGYVKW